jgi:hypothetical protein
MGLSLSRKRARSRFGQSFFISRSRVEEQTKLLHLNCSLTRHFLHLASFTETTADESEDREEREK